jgi:hypothetical protein
VERGEAISTYANAAPSVDSHWRALILFGANVASYKFALGRSLLELGAEGRTFVALDELAEPFARHLCRHLRVSDHQTTSRSSRFLDACRAHNAGELTDDQLRTRTVQLGFNNVIDAFHVLDRSPSATRFFVDERGGAGGIRLTDELLELAHSPEADALSTEVESRWSLVEAAWELNLPRSLLTVTYDAETATLGATDRRRTAITGARGALNGYQKGACFYCYASVAVTPGSPDLGQVDHVFAWSFGATVGGAPVDGVWNLVLACSRCNGWHEKSNRPPHLRYVERLHRRNEFLIASHHPLRPTLIAQTGATADERARTLRAAYDEVTVHGARTAWEAPDERAPRF